MKKYSYVLSRFYLFLLVISVFPKVYGMAAPTPISPPDNINLVATGGGTGVRVEWVYTNPLPSDPGTFEILRQDGGAGGFNVVGSIAYTPGNPSDYDWTDAGPLTDSTLYEYQVQIKTNNGNFESDPALAMASITTVQLTGTPQIFNPNIKTNSSLTFVIVDGVTGEEGYNIYIKESGQALFTKVNSPTVVNFSEEPRTISGLKANTVYDIYVVAFKGGTRIISNTVVLKTNRDLPPKPSVFKVDFLCPDRAIVSFSFADYTQFDEWELRRGAEILAFGNAAPSITRDLTGLIANYPYPLTVLTRNETGATISDVNYFVTPKYEAPLAPINVSGPSNVTQNSITVNWQNAAEDKDCYNKLRTENTIFVTITKRDGTVENRIEATYKDATAYTVTNLPMKATVTIIVAAVGPRGTTYGAPVTGVTLGPPYAPTDVAGTAGRDALGDGEIVLTWKDNAADEDGAIIEIGTGPGTFKFLSTIDKNITKFIHKPIQSGLTYSYRIKYFNTYGDSEYSTVYTIIPSFTKEPKAPFNLNAIAGTGVINLKWQDDSNEESGFEISRSIDAGVIWTKLGTVGVNVVTFTDSDVKSGTVYWYGVRAINEVGSSDRATTKITFGTVVANMRVNVFPNPTVDAINLRIDYSGNGSVSIINESNRRVLSKSVQFNNEDVNIDLSRFPPGAYQVIINTGESQISRKIYKY
jgi:hypothetical protein